MLLLAELTQPTIAIARAADRPIDIPAGPLSDSLARFSDITGLSVGLPGSMPHVRTQAVTGETSPAAALRRMLKGTGLQARRVGGIFRIEPLPRQPRPTSERRQAATGTPVAQQLTDIVVTAQKRPQTLNAVPMSVAVLPIEKVAGGGRTLTSRDMVMGTEGLSMTNLGPGRNRQFIRGVADSPFNGQSQSTVAIQVDDARVTYDAPDPDLRLVDVERVELLKGPQGPLYGSGALGGIYRIVTRRPELGSLALSTRASAESVAHGGIGTGVEGVTNIPVGERLAIRAVGYRRVDAGWINNEDGRDDSNSAETLGWRVAARWKPAQDWTIDAGLMGQDINARDSQYVAAGAENLSRDSRIPEPTDNDFLMGHATVETMVGPLRLLSATSYVDHGFDYSLDASEAAGDFGLTGPTTFTDNRKYTLFNHEVRLSSTGRRHWLVGASVLRATSRGVSTLDTGNGATLIAETLDRRTTELATFGEYSTPLLGRVEGTLGLRLSHTISEDEASETMDQRSLRRNKTIVSPSLAFSLPLAGQGIVYLRYARAMRPGGLAPAGETTNGRFDADELDTIDLGFRRASVDGSLSVSASGYATQWSSIQSDYLLPNGLVSTRNAGSGRIFGFETAIDWTIGWGFSVSAGGAVQDARLTRTQDGAEVEDRRLPVSPDLTGRLSIAKAVALGRWDGSMALQANYLGSARLSFDSDLDREMGNYAVFAAHSQWTRGTWTIGMRIDNIMDARGDSFAFGNPFSIRNGRQYTPLRPRTVMLSVARDW